MSTWDRIQMLLNMGLFGGGMPGYGGPGAPGGGFSPFSGGGLPWTPEEDAGPPMLSGDGSTYGIPAPPPAPEPAPVSSPWFKPIDTTGMSSPLVKGFADAYNRTQGGIFGQGNVGGNWFF